MTSVLTQTQVRTLNTMRIDALANKGSVLMEDSRTDTGTVTTSSTTYTEVPDTTLTLKLSRPSRVALAGTFIGGGANSPVLFNSCITQLRLGSTGYGLGVAMGSTSAWVQGASAYTTVDLEAGIYTFGLFFKTDTLTLSCKMTERTISYVIVDNNYYKDTNGKFQ